MSNYTVVWHKAAEDKLADIWIHSLDREAVRQAADRIEQILKDSPPRSRASSSDQLFQHWQSPLYILYSISDPDRLVCVTFVKIDSLN